jgi:hypothetical protein
VPQCRTLSIVDIATAARPRTAGRYAVGTESKRPVARDSGLIWLLTLLGGLGLLFWSAVVLALVALL